MEFNIRAISLVQIVSADERISVSDVVGKEIEFRAGIRYSITMPPASEDFTVLSEPEKTLTALSGWARLYHQIAGVEKLSITKATANRTGAWPT
jgi:hypothetical protein